MCAPSYCKWNGLASGGLVGEMQMSKKYLNMDDDDDDNEAGAERRGE